MKLRIGSTTVCVVVLGLLAACGSGSAGEDGTEVDDTTTTSGSIDTSSTDTTGSEPDTSSSTAGKDGDSTSTGGDEGSSGGISSGGEVGSTGDEASSTGFESTDSGSESTDSGSSEGSSSTSMGIDMSCEPEFFGEAVPPEVDHRWLGVTVPAGSPCPLAQAPWTLDESYYPIPGYETTICLYEQLGPPPIEFCSLPWLDETPPWEWLERDLGVVGPG